jgi:hypothetical protein
MIPLLIVTFILVGGPLLVVFILGMISFCGGDDEGFPLLAIVAMMLVCLTATSIAMYQNRFVPLAQPAAEAAP